MLRWNAVCCGVLWFVCAMTACSRFCSYPTPHAPNYKNQRLSHRTGAERGARACCAQTGAPPLHPSHYAGRGDYLLSSLLLFRFSRCCWLLSFVCIGPFFASLPFVLLSSCLTCFVYNRFAIALRVLGLRVLAIASQIPLRSPYNYFAFASQSLCDCYAIALRLLCCCFVIALRSLCDRFTIYCFAIASQSL
jgi:hypothetical protein